MATATCINCKFFKSDNELGTEGVCKRYPVTMHWSPQDECPVSIPTLIDMPATEYCGEFQAQSTATLPVFRNFSIIPIQPLQSAEDGEELNVS